MKGALIAGLCFLVIGNAGVASELRIARPTAQDPAQAPRLQAPDTQVPMTLFNLPATERSVLLQEPVFCSVLLCHGTCSHRGSGCTLRTFNKLLSQADSGCCAQPSLAQEPQDHCGSHECCE